MADQSRYVGRVHRPAPRRPNFIPTTPNYFAYQWLDKDPDMDLIVGLIGESGLSPEDIEHETAKLGWRVSRFTVLNWLYGSVRRPQNFTLTIVAMALGYVKRWEPAMRPATLAAAQPTQPAEPTRSPIPKKPQSERVNVAHH